MVVICCIIVLNVLALPKLREKGKTRIGTVRGLSSHMEEDDDTEAPVGEQDNWNLFPENGRAHQHVDEDGFVLPSLPALVDPMISGWNTMFVDQQPSPLEPWYSQENEPSNQGRLPNESAEDLDSFRREYFEGAPQGNVSQAEFEDTFQQQLQTGSYEVSEIGHVNLHPAIESDVPLASRTVDVNQQLLRTEQTKQKTVQKGKRKAVKCTQIEKVPATPVVFKTKKPGARPKYLIGAEDSEDVKRRRAEECFTSKQCWFFCFCLIFHTP